MKKFLTQPTKLIAFGAVGFVVGAVGHNLVYAVFGVEEAVFFLLAVVVGPVAFFAGVMGVVFTGFRGRRK